MKKFGMIVAVLAVLAMAGQAWAGGGCCPSKSAKKEAGWDKASCTSALSGIELTAEQEAKIAKIEADCKASGMTVDACSKSMSAIRDVLSDDQKVAFDAASSKSSKKGGCEG
jgi:hypothetical protein